MAQTLAKEQRYLSDYQAFQRSAVAQGPAWVSHLRQEALSHFNRLGFPTARRGNERWKYTNVAPIARATFHYPLDLNPNTVTAAELRKLAPWEDGWINLVFVDGQHCPGLSSPAPNSDGILVTNLAEALSSDGVVVEPHLARYASCADDGFTALNTAFLRDGAFIHIPDGTSLESPLHLVFVTSGQKEPTVSYPRTLLVAGQHSRLTVIESYVSLARSRYFTNAVVEMVLGDGAKIEHYRLLKEDQGGFHVGTSRVHLGQDSAFTSTSFATGSALARHDLYVLLDGPGSSCHLNGLYLTSGAQHMDNYINIDHAKPRGTSRLYYKGILDGKSRAVFGGIVLVRKDAQKTDAHQSDKNLILSESAEVDSKPSLQIYADDVKCGHGATAGHIDQDTLFYMRSRGLDVKTASGLLIRGFANEIIDTVQLESFRAYLDRLFLEALPSFQFGGTL
jgi:Fe-S cluster assembly protein SufD